MHIDTANKYHDMMLYLKNINVLKFSSRTVSNCYITVAVIYMLKSKASLFTYAIKCIDHIFPTWEWKPEAFLYKSRKPSALK